MRMKSMSRIILLLLWSVLQAMPVNKKDQRHQRQRIFRVEEKQEFMHSKEVFFKGHSQLILDQKTHQILQEWWVCTNQYEKQLNALNSQLKLGHSSSILLKIEQVKQQLVNCDNSRNVAIINRLELHNRREEIKRLQREIESKRASEQEAEQQFESYKEQLLRAISREKQRKILKKQSEAEQEEERKIKQEAKVDPYLQIKINPEDALRRRRNQFLQQRQRLLENIETTRHIAAISLPEIQPIRSRIVLLQEKIKVVQRKTADDLRVFEVGIKTPKIAQQPSIIATEDPSIQIERVKKLIRRTNYETKTNKKLSWNHCKEILQEINLFKRYRDPKVSAEGQFYFRLIEIFQTDCRKMPDVIQLNDEEKELFQRYKISDSQKIQEKVTYKISVEQMQILLRQIEKLIQRGEKEILKFKKNKKLVAQDNTFCQQFKFWAQKANLKGLSQNNIFEKAKKMYIDFCKSESQLEDFSRIEQKSQEYLIYSQQCTYSAAVILDKAQKKTALTKNDFKNLELIINNLKNSNTHELNEALIKKLSFLIQQNLRSQKQRLLLIRQNRRRLLLAIEMAGPWIQQTNPQKIDVNECSELYNLLVDQDAQKQFLHAYWIDSLEDFYQKQCKQKFQQLQKLPFRKRLRDKKIQKNKNFRNGEIVIINKDKYKIINHDFARPVDPIPKTTQGHPFGAVAPNQQPKDFDYTLLKGKLQIWKDNAWHFVGVTKEQIRRYNYRVAGIDIQAKTLMTWKKVNELSFEAYYVLNGFSSYALVGLVKDEYEKVLKIVNKNKQQLLLKECDFLKGFIIQVIVANLLEQYNFLKQYYQAKCSAFYRFTSVQAQGKTEAKKHQFFVQQSRREVRKFQRTSKQCYQLIEFIKRAKSEHAQKWRRVHFLLDRLEIMSEKQCLGSFFPFQTSQTFKTDIWRQVETDLRDKKQQLEVRAEIAKMETEFEQIEKIKAQYKQISLELCEKMLQLLVSTPLRLSIKTQSQLVLKLQDYYEEMCVPIYSKCYPVPIRQSAADLKLEVDLGYEDGQIVQEENGDKFQIFSEGRLARNIKSIDVPLIFLKNDYKFAKKALQLAKIKQSLLRKKSKFQIEDCDIFLQYVGKVLNNLNQEQKIKFKDISEFFTNFQFVFCTQLWQNKQAPLPNKCQIRFIGKNLYFWEKNRWAKVKTTALKSFRAGDYYVENEKVLLKKKESSEVVAAISNKQLDMKYGRDRIVKPTAQRMFRRVKSIERLKAFVINSSNQRERKRKESLTGSIDSVISQSQVKKTTFMRRVIKLEGAVVLPSDRKVDAVPQEDQPPQEQPNKIEINRSILDSASQILYSNNKLKQFLTTQQCEHLKCLLDGQPSYKDKALNQKLQTLENNYHLLCTEPPLKFRLRESDMIVEGTSNDNQVVAFEGSCYQIVSGGKYARKINIKMLEAWNKKQKKRANDLHQQAQHEIAKLEIEMEKVRSLNKQGQYLHANKQKCKEFQMKSLALTLTKKKSGIIEKTVKLIDAKLKQFTHLWMINCQGEYEKTPQSSLGKRGLSLSDYKSQMVAFQDYFIELKHSKGQVTFDKCNELLNCLTLWSKHGKALLWESNPDRQQRRLFAVLEDIILNHFNMECATQFPDLKLDNWKIQN